MKHPSPRIRIAKFVSLGAVLAFGTFALPQAPPAPSATATAAEASGKLPEFEVVSLKPSDPNVGHHMGVQLSADRISMNYITLAGLICVAYNIPYWEVSGAEPWMARDMTDPKDHFDLEAKMPQNLAPYDQRHSNFEVGDERVRQMMQAMLADRFHLKFHRETVVTAHIRARTPRPHTVPADLISIGSLCIGATGSRSRQIEHRTL